MKVKKKAGSGNIPPKKRVVQKEGMRELGLDELGRVQGGVKKKAAKKKAAKKKKGGNQRQNACENANENGKAHIPFC